MQSQEVGEAARGEGRDTTGERVRLQVSRSDVLDLLLRIILAGDAEEDPVSDPLSRSGLSPACSRASQDTSSKRRCWGSTKAASRGDIPKNAASKWSTSERNPPRLEDTAAAASDENRRYRSVSCRDAGRSVIPCLPLLRKSQNDSGSSAPPGIRHPMPTMATGSLPVPARWSSSARNRRISRTLAASAPRTSSLLPLYI